MSEKKNLDHLSDESFYEYLKFIHSATGITISNTRKSMVQGRLRKRIQHIGLENYDHYLDYLKNTLSEKQFLIDLITTNETYFFRTPRIWEYIEKKFLPQWYKTNPNQIFNAWSAAASSGEEAHSLGIVCQSFKEKNPGFIYQIVGTDISQDMISLCKQGFYKDKSIDFFKNHKPFLFKKYMDAKDQKTYQISYEIKNRLNFYNHNLFNQLNTNENFEIILLRNVLIYFNKKDQEFVINRLHKNLSKNGVLIIGESESLSNIKTEFDYIEPLIYRIKNKFPVHK